MRPNAWIGEALKRRGITQKELAVRTGMDPTILSRKLRCDREFLYSEVVKICLELDIDNPLPIFDTKKIKRDGGTSRSAGRAISS